MFNHLRRDIVLKLTVLHASSIAHDMKHHLVPALDILSNCGKVGGKIVVIRRQSEGPRQRLKADVSVADRVQRTDAGVRLGALWLRTRTDFAWLEIGDPCLVSWFSSVGHSDFPWCSRQLIAWRAQPSILDACLRLISKSLA